jgi:hypothetical protein
MFYDLLLLDGWDKILGRLKTSFTFSTEFFLDGTHIMQRKKCAVAGAKPVLHVVFVDAARPDVFAHELKAVSEGDKLWEKAQLNSFS